MTCRFSWSPDRAFCYARGSVDKADTAWMLVSTALVLLMTPALGFFYGGLVRSKNALNTMMMSVVVARLRRASPGPLARLLARLRAGLAAGSAGSRARCSCAASASSRRARSRTSSSWPTRAPSRSSPRRSSPARSSSGCASAPTSPSSRSGASSSTRRSRTGSGAAASSRKLGALDFAGGTVVHVNAGVGGARGRGRARARARTTRARRSCRTTCPSRCSAPGCSGSAGSASTPAARSRRTASPALAFVNTMLAPAATLVVWTLLDLARTGKATAVGAATAIVVGLVAITPAAGFVGPMSGARCSARIAAFPSYFALALARADAARRLARRRGRARPRRHGRARCSPASSPQKAWNGTADGLLFGNPRQLGDPGARGARGDRLQRRRDLRAAEARRRSSSPLRGRRRARKASAST